MAKKKKCELSQPTVVSMCFFGLYDVTGWWTRRLPPNLFNKHRTSRALEGLFFNVSDAIAASKEAF
jgi:hypothetical protein